MNIAFFVYHPVEPHFFKNIAKSLEYKHNVFFYVIEKEGIECKILANLGFNYYKLGNNKSNLFSRMVNIPLLLLKIFFRQKKDKINLIISATSPYVGLLRRICNIPSIGFTDTETASFNNRIAMSGFDSILTPDCFYKEISPIKHIPYKAYKEIAYLHPNWFKKDETVLDKLNIKKNEKIILLRFSALKAMHDVGLKSVGDNKKIILNYIKELEKYARVFISMTEKELGPEFVKYRLDIHPSDYIHLLAHCSLYIGEGTTTASEAGVLGIPWIALRPQALGYLIDQEKNYQLGFRTEDIDFAFKKALGWIQDKELLNKWKAKREKLLKDKIDLTAFLTWFIENYPQSHKIMKENPEYQERFR